MKDKVPSHPCFIRVNPWLNKETNLDLMKIFDISRALSNDLAPWPGDTPFHFELKWKMAEGATVNVGAVNMGVHNGTHADAMFHFDEGGDSIERMPLDAYVGERGRGRSDESVRGTAGMSSTGHGKSVWPISRLFRPRSSRRRGFCSRREFGRIPRFFRIGFR